MIGTTVSQYSAFWNPAPERNPRQRDKIIQKPRQKDGGRVGECAMGVVHESHGTKLVRDAALKFVPAHEVTVTEEDKVRFLQEARAISALNHPNIATIYDIDEANENFFWIFGDHRVDYGLPITFAGRRRSFVPPPAT